MVGIHMDFMKAIPRKSIVTIEGKVVFSGKTSVTVYTTVTVENYLKKNQFLSSKGYVTYVAVDEEGKPIGVPNLKISSDEEKKLNQEVLQYRKNHKF